MLTMAVGVLLAAGVAQAGDRRNIYVTGPDGLRHYRVYTDDRGNRMDIFDGQTGQTYHVDGLNPITPEEASDPSDWLKRMDHALDALDQDPQDW